MDKHSIIFVGTSAFGIPTLRAIHGSDDFFVEAVFTQSDRRVGRKQLLSPTPVKEAAERLRIPVYEGDVVRLRQLFRDVKPDIAVIISFGQIIPADILNIPAKGCINLHASLLPKYRGASPIQTALANGDTETGLTIIQMDKWMDSGDILGQKKIPIYADDIFETLHERLSGSGASFILDTLKNIFSLSLIEQSQEESTATYCQKITRIDGYIDFFQYGAREIINFYRAYHPWPGIYTFFRGKRLKLLKIGLEALDKDADPGRVIEISPKTLVIATKKGAISLQSVQIEGRNPMNIENFCRGFPDFIGAKLERDPRLKIS